MDRIIGTLEWWHQVATEEALYGHSETLDNYYAEQGVTILHTPPPA